jgi:hypothetical protein
MFNFMIALIAKKFTGNFTTRNDGLHSLSKSLLKTLRAHQNVFLVSIYMAFGSSFDLLNYSFVQLLSVAVFIHMYVDRDFLRTRHMTTAQ